MHDVDYTKPVQIEVADIHSLRIYFAWSQDTVGFGECYVSIEPNGKIEANTECMSRQWLRHALHALADLVADKAVLTD